MSYTSSHYHHLLFTLIVKKHPKDLHFIKSRVKSSQCLPHFLPLLIFSEFQLL